MAAELLLRSKGTDLEGDLRSLVIWRVPRTPRQPDGIHYRFAFIPRGSRRAAIVYDNHHPKGHHKHVAGVEAPYEFTTLDRLVRDFEADISRWKARG
jgi:hypothetical protein